LNNGIHRTSKLGGSSGGGSNLPVWNGHQPSPQLSGLSAIEDSQRRHNLGVLKVNLDEFLPQESYREMRQIDYEEYGRFCSSVHGY
jgi:hypothetical protein